MTYINVSSSTLAIRKFSLGKRVTPNHLCMNLRVGLWISLVQGLWQTIYLDISCQKRVLSNSFKASSTSTLHNSWNPKMLLKFFQVGENGLLKSLNETSYSPNCRVLKNSIVTSIHPFSIIVQASSQPTFQKISWNSESIPMVCKRFGLMTGVDVNSLSFGSL
jgi:hypothetical protein